MKNITYPFIPKGKTIHYVPAGNEYMKAAKEFALSHSLDKNQQTGSIIVKNGEIIGKGANGSDYHETHECERAKRGIPTGQGYELCEGCHPKNHSERKAIEDAKSKNNDTAASNLYLWGHWWCCEPCWNAMEDAGIKNIYLLEESEKLFNRDHLENILPQK